MYKFVMGHPENAPDAEIIALVINDNIVAHSQLVDGYMHGFTITHAGFASFSEENEMEAYGKSVSVNVGTDGLDKEYFTDFVTHSLCVQHLPVIQGASTRDVFILYRAEKDSLSLADQLNLIAQHEYVCPFLDAYFAANFDF